MKEAGMDIDEPGDNCIDEESEGRTFDDLEQELDTALKVFYNEQMDTRKRSLQRLQKTVGGMMKWNRVDASTQVPEVGEALASDASPVPGAGIAREFQR